MDGRDAASLVVAARAADLFDAATRASHAEDDVVAEVARRGHVDPARLRAEWDATPDRDLDVVAFALAQAGKPYVFAAAGPDAYDCSGLTMAAWATQGVHLAHFAATQYAQTQRVRPADLRPGDLVFFEADLGHVGLYLGARLMVHAPHTGDVVRVASVADRDGMRTGRVGASR
jgi:cell wall-associated NlpC family hydrolase